MTFTYTVDIHVLFKYYNNIIPGHNFTIKDLPSVLILVNALVNAGLIIFYAVLTNTTDSHVYS